MPASGIVTERIGRGSPLLLLHGGLVDRRSWEGQRELAGQLTLLMPDTRGFGDSWPMTPPTDMANLVEDVVRVVEVQGFDSVHLLGFSIGGIIAQAVAVDRPELVKSLVLVSTRLAPRSRSANVRPPPVSPSAHVSRAFSAAFREGNATFIRRYTEIATEHYERSSMSALATAVQSGADAAAVGRIGVPVLVMHAADDSAIEVRRGEELAQAIPHSQFERFENCGHSLHIERTVDFNRLVLSFVSKADHS
jgi:3-oxoadipate enol-lactonase